MRNVMKKGIFILSFAFFIAAVFFVLPFFYIRAAEQAGLFLNPASGTFLVGSTFDVSVVLDTKGVSVNTVEVELSFPSDKIQVASPSVGRSIIQLWPAPPVFSNREGKIYFVGGIPSPGIVTSQGVVLTLTFRVISPGEAEIRFGEKTSVLANDGRGTDILGQKPSAFYRFSVPPSQGPVISSPTHPDQERWYRDPNPLFVWPRGQFADGYSFAFDRDPSGFPDTIAEGQAPTASFENKESGIWYFHLRERSGGVWGGASHFVVRIDAESPASFRINVSPGMRTTNKNPIFRFFTTDSLSGFDHFEMKIVSLSQGQAADSLFFEVASPYQAVNLDSGRYRVIMRALDRAGNTRDETALLNIVGSFTQFWGPDGIDLVFVFIPWFRLLLILMLLMVITLVFLILFWIHHKHHLQHAFREDFKKLFGGSKNILGGGSGAAALLLVVGFLLLVAAGAHAALLPEIPTINIAPSRYYPLDESLYLEGRAAPNSAVDIVFEKIAGGAQPVRVSADANVGGEWFFSARLELASGEWSARARSIRGDAYSEWSNPRIIRATVSGFSIFGITVRYVSGAVALLVMLVAAGALFIYAALRVKKAEALRFEEELRSQKDAVRLSERRMTERVLEQNFAEVRKRVLDELDHLEITAHQGGALSQEEEEHRAGLLRELREAEESIERELEHI